MGTTARLSSEQLSTLRETLEHSRTELEGALASAEPESALPETVRRLARICDRRKAAMRSKERLGLWLNQVRAALWRMSVGEYGTCLICDGAIGFSRLQLKPETTRCSRCQLHGDEWRPRKRLAPDH